VTNPDAIPFNCEVEQVEAEINVTSEKKRISTVIFITIM
jgi:hypothetical protein